MARAPFTITVLDTAGNVKAGASVTVRRRSDSSLATVYGGETGAGTVANPLTTDAAGRASAWLERGAYRADVTGTGITAYSVNVDASPAADGAVDGAWLSSSAIPVGAVMPYVGAGDPAGGAWLVADGRAVSRTTYSGLYGVVGTTYGAGDGSTTFNLPDLRGRVPVGEDGAAGRLTANDARGQSGGSETVTLTTAQIPPTPISVDTRTVSESPGDSGQASLITGSAPVRSKAGLVYQSPAPGGGSHPNMPPYLVVTYIIKAL